MTDYRLIWFQHFQKAAGTSIVRMAELNGERLYPGHRNGNPHDEEGREIRLWDLDENGLKAFVDGCEQDEVTFVATEKFGPDFSLLSADPRVRLVTALREPLKRFLSHYYYSFYTGRSDLTRPERFANSLFISSMSNYYCRIFSRHHEDPRPVEGEHFETSMSVLESFDYRGVIENHDFMGGLFATLGWMEKEVRINKTRLNVSGTLRLMAKFQYDLLWRRLRYPVTEPEEEFVELFRQQNKWDYLLYEAARGEQPNPI